MLVEEGKAKKFYLSDQIEEVLPTLPHYVSINLDSIRVVGNFAAHPQKSKNTGEILDVESGEAEWNLDVLDDLFDFYYVKPSQNRIKREKINSKLIAAGNKVRR